MSKTNSGQSFWSFVRSELRTHQDAVQQRSNTPPGAGPAIHDDDEAFGHVLGAAGRTQAIDQKAGFSGTRENAGGSPVGAVLGATLFSRRTGVVDCCPSKPDRLRESGEAVIPSLPQDLETIHLNRTQASLNSVSVTH